ncbi:hypothetical protein BKA65DRAFT_482368 [Rhexocercosporidium sp. MPI-PUGE-AT-0058]|nr:hypothetical protein BKA65DRAFT_482368 [Rhexocercosporidium sp. MPI-PUGE-AT-0058]
MVKVQKLKMRDSNNRRSESVKNAVKAMWAAGDIKSLTDRLSNLRSATETHILVYIKEKLDSDSLQNSASFSNLDKQNRLIIKSLSEHTALEKALLAESRDQIATLVQLKHSKTRDVIANQDSGNSNSSLLGRVVATIELMGVSDDEEERLKKSVNNNIVNALAHPSMISRYEHIAESYPQTFEWAFHDSATEKRPWSKIAAGVPSIFTVPSTTSFTDLVPVAFPDKWATTYAGFLENTKNRVQNEIHHTFKLKRLVSAFRAVIHQTSIPVKICFLVDGLDELEGHHDEMSDLFKEIITSEDVKICLSSRPWVVFHDSFKDCPFLRLQDLTLPEIQCYVRGKFGRSKAFRLLRENEPESTKQLLNGIIDKAAGVFLWVQIVVDSLLRGMQNRDEIGILQERLRCMPRELQPLYHHLLGLIEPHYQIWASKVFQIIRAHRYQECCSGSSNWPPAVPQNHTPFRLSTLCYVMSDGLEVMHADSTLNWVYAGKFSSTTEVFTPESLRTSCQKMQVHLTARCAGLLEVPTYDQRGPKAEIEYLHRTARDYIEDEDNWSKIVSHTLNVDFDPCLAILNVGPVLLAMKCGGSESYTQQQVSRMVNKSLLCAYKMSCDAKLDKPITKVLESLISTIAQWKSYGRANKFHRPLSSDGHRRTSNWILRLLGPTDQPQPWECVNLATLFGYVDYVRRKLLQLKATSEIATQLLLSLIDCKEEPEDFLIPGPQPEIVSLLLEFGADPEHDSEQDSEQDSEGFHDQQGSLKEHGFSQNLDGDIIKLLVDAGERKILKKREIEDGDESSGRHNKHPSNLTTTSLFINR